MPDLAQLFVFPLFMVFCRVGAAILIFPGLSDPSITPRARLLLAAGVSVVIWPLVAPTFPQFPADTATLALYVVQELIMGLLLGIAARLFVAAMNVAGEMIAFASGFQAATLFDPTTGGSSSAPTLFLMMIAAMLVFALNLHHLLIQGVVQSYTVFPLGQLPPIGDVTQAAIQIVQDIFLIGLQLSAPVVVVGFLGYLTFGIFNRLIPQLQVFFVALPVSIFVGLLVLWATLSTMLVVFSAQLVEHVNLFALP